MLYRICKADINHNPLGAASSKSDFKGIYNVNSMRDARELLWEVNLPPCHNLQIPPYLYTFINYQTETNMLSYLGLDLYYFIQYIEHQYRYNKSKYPATKWWVLQQTPTLQHVFYILSRFNNFDSLFIMI